jgi:carboxymethylenebutenolidase
VILAPDLYNGKIATTIEEAKLLRSKLRQQKAYSDLLGMVDYLHRLDRVTSNTVGIIGFSLGARFALELSTEHSKDINSCLLWKQQCRLLVFSGSLSWSLRRR